MLLWTQSVYWDDKQRLMRKMAYSDSEAVIADEFYACLKLRNRHLISNGLEARSPCVFCNVKDCLYTCQLSEVPRLFSSILFCKNILGARVLAAQMICSWGFAILARGVFWSNQSIIVPSTSLPRKLEIGPSWYSLGRATCRRMWYPAPGPCNGSNDLIVRLKTCATVSNGRTRFSRGVLSKSDHDT